MAAEGCRHWGYGLMLGLKLKHMRGQSLGQALDNVVRRSHEHVPSSGVSVIARPSVEARSHMKEDEDS